MSTQIEERDYLRRTHPEYDQKSPIWASINLLFNGAERLSNLAATYITSRLGETPEQYSHRLGLVTYSPILPDTVRDLTKKIKSGILSVNFPGQKWSLDFNWVTFSQDLANDIATYGRVVAVLSDTGPTLINPTQLTNYGKYRDGSPWYVFKESGYVSPGPFDDALEFETITLIDSQNISKYLTIKGAKGAETLTVESELHGYGFCPVVMLDSPPEMYVALSALPKAIQHFRIENVVNEAAYLLYIQRTLEKSRQPDDDLDDTFSVQTGNEHLILGNMTFSEASGTSVTTGIELLKQIQADIKSIISLGSMGGGGLATSGVARRYDYHDYSLTISDLGNYVKDVVTSILSLYSTSDSFEVLGLDVFQVDNLEYFVAVLDTLSPHSDKIEPGAMQAWIDKIESCLYR